MSFEWYINRWGLILLGLGLFVKGILMLTGQPDPFPPVVEGLWALIAGALILLGR